VKLATDLSAAMRLYSSTYETPGRTNNLLRLLWTSFSALSSPLTMTLLYRQQRHTITYKNTKVGGAATQRQKMLGADIKRR
jgi:hypothetical protein